MPATAATPRRQAEDNYAPDTAIQGTRVAEVGSVYVDTPLTRARSDAPGDRNAASYYAATPLTTAAADEAGYEIAREDDAAVVLGGYEVPLDDDAAVNYSVPSNSSRSAQVSEPVKLHPPPRHPSVLPRVQ